MYACEMDGTRWGGLEIKLGGNPGIRYVKNNTNVESSKESKKEKWYIHLGCRFRDVE